MASRNEREIFPVPAGGVRKDVNPLATTPEMARDAENIFVFDGTARPRPAHTREGFAQQANTWIDVAVNMSLPANRERAGFFVVGTTICCLVRVTPGWAEYELYTSTDDGTTWAQDVAMSGLDGLENDLNDVFTAGNTVVFLDSIGRIYLADVTTYPTAAMTFALLGTLPTQNIHAGDPTPTILGYDDRISKSQYDPTTGYWMVVVHFWDSQTLSNWRVYFLPDIENAAGLVLDTDYYEVTQYQQGFEIVFTYHLAGDYLLMDTVSWYQGIDINGNPVFYQATTIGYLFEITVGVPYTFAGSSPDPIYNPGRVIDIIGDPTGTYDAILLVKSEVKGITITGSTFAEVQIKDLEQDVQFSSHMSFVAHDGTDQILVTGSADTSVSHNDGITWDEQSVYVLPSPREWKRPLQIGNTFFFGGIEQWGARDWESRAHLSIVSGTIYPASYDVAEDIGLVTSIMQMDQDTESDAIFVGTTKKLMHLNRGTSIWEEITGPAVAVEPESPDTRMEGVHGDNPVVFRNFEVGGKTYLLSTNGETQPLVYHPDLPNGKARFMGSILSTADPGYIDGDDNPYGSAAPVARAMASAANRIMLLNLPGVSPSAVDVCTFLDFDRGWQGDQQLTILGDTPGGIISGNEISALQVAVYKEDAIYHAVAQTDILGIPAPFRFELVRAGISGPCSPLCVLPMHTGSQVYLARDGGVYLYDGSTPRDVGRNVRAMIQPYLDENTYGKSWGMIDSHRKLAWFFFPTKAGALNRGVVLSMDQGQPWPVWPVKFPDGWEMAAGRRAYFLTDKIIGEMREQMTGYQTKTLGSFQDGREEMIIGRLNNTWYTQLWDAESYTDDGNSIPVNLETGWHQYGSVVQIKTTGELYHVFKAAGDALELDVNLLAEQLNQTIRDDGSVALANGNRNHRTSHRTSGERFAIKLSGNIRFNFSWGGARATFRRRGPR